MYIKEAALAANSVYVRIYINLFGALCHGGKTRSTRRQFLLQRLVLSLEPRIFRTFFVLQDDSSALPDNAVLPSSISAPRNKKF